MKKVYSVSVGIPAYNEEANIKKLLLSVLEQKGESFHLNKIIVISDGSTDSTVGKVKEVKDKRVKLIIKERRNGQSLTQNEIIRHIPKNTDGLILFEADTLPKDKNYIENLVGCMPKDRQFSLISSESGLITSGSFFEKVIDFSFKLKKEIFENANENEFNLYLSNISLLSRRFLKKFRWSQNFHDDSYCYREAIKSRLPIIRCKNAVLYKKSVNNLKDYLLQSGKFLKARQKEEKFSDIYKLRLNYFPLSKILAKYFLKNPILFVCYLLLLVVSRAYSKFLPSYNHTWTIYKSSKYFPEASI